MSTDPIQQKLNDALKHINNQRQQLQAIRDRLLRVESVLDVVLADDWGLWLYRNRAERMDPTVPIFDPERAAFHLFRYQFALSFVADKIVCDVACGTGYGAQLMKQSGRAVRVIGVDLCPQAIEYARAKHSAAGVEFAVGDVASLPLESETIDVVVSFETIEHVTNESQVVAEYARVLKPGGLLICSTPNEWPLEIAPFHTREYNRHSFCQLLGQQFTVQTLYNQNSGSSFAYNREQPSGIVTTTDDNHHLAECFIAVAVKS